MPPPVNALTLDVRLVEAMIDAGTVRADGQEKRADRHETDIDNLRMGLRRLECRIHDLEITSAEARGASALLPKILPVAAVVISTSALLHSLGVF